MIDPCFLVINDHGLYCRAGDFYVDPRQPVGLAVISHAHGDHAVKGNKKVFCTPPTAAIMQLRYKKMAGGEFAPHAYREPFIINGVKIWFLSAGHILGSSQVMMEHNGIKYLYTGDIKLQEDKTCEGIELAEADVLITETTFADPAIKHPDPYEEIKKLNDIHFPILLGAYSLGKSQRLIALIANFCPDKQVLVHHTIDPINKLYSSFLFHPGEYSLYTRKAVREMNREHIYIVPPLTFNSYFKAKNVVKVFASGWKALQVRNGTELYISDHADWNDLIHIIEKVRPAEIWTLHGDGRHLRQHFAGKIVVKILD